MRIQDLAIIYMKKNFYKTPNIMIKSGLVLRANARFNYFRIEAVTK